MLKKLISLGMIASLAISGYAILPRVLEAAAIFGIRHDPTRVLLYRLSDLDKPAFEKEITAALEKDDPELARSLADLAGDRDIAIDQATLARIASAEEFSITRTTSQLFHGAVTGEADSPTAFAGALASDLTLIGDVRDLTQQAVVYPKQDNLTVALAATGIVLTGALAFSCGTSAAGKVGISAIKAARKMKRLSKGVERALVRLTADAVDTRVLKSVTRDIGSWNFAAAFNGTKRLIKPRVIDELTQTGDAVRHVFTKQGYRGTLQVLESADDTTDIRKFRRISDDLGSKFRGALYLKRGGKLTLHVAEILLTFLWWIISAVGWVLWAAYYGVRLTWKVGRLVYRLSAFVVHRTVMPWALQSPPNRSISPQNS
ncbi:MAG: hypothetical protein JWL86_2188 [Rhizobium sp.]|nr:hypothetical protein [Rhizobium sp.]